MTETSHRLKHQAAHLGPVSRDVGAALAALPDDERLRLRALARLRVRSLPGGVSWSDLLHEAVATGRAAGRFPCRHHAEPV